MITEIKSVEGYNFIKSRRDNPKFTIIDVRTPAEYVQGHLEDTLHLDIDSPSFEEEVFRLDKNKSYFLYCQFGDNRSRAAGKLMENTGFKEIYVLEGGFNSWEAHGFPTEK